MSEEEKNESRPFRWTHPYIMDPDEFEDKMGRPMVLKEPERLKAMLREFVSYHGYCDRVRRFLSCNIDRIANGEKPHKWPPFNLPGDCPDPQQY